MLTCKETSELVSRGMDTALPLAQRLAIRLHLFMCGACRRFDAQMQFIRRAAGRYPGADREPG